MFSNISKSPRLLDQVVTDLIKAVAIEETALSNILELESDIIRKAKTDAVNLEEFVAVNESVNTLIGKIAEVQTVTSTKLREMKELVQKMESLYCTRT